MTLKLPGMYMLCTVHLMHRRNVPQSRQRTGVHNPLTKHVPRASEDKTLPRAHDRRQYPVTNAACVVG
jgi:hypothetical protein